MAKKTVATLQSGEAKITKIIKCIKKKNGYYSFKSEFVPSIKIEYKKNDQ